MENYFFYILFFFIIIFISIYLNVNNSYQRSFEFGRSPSAFDANYNLIEESKIVPIEFFNNINEPFKQKKSNPLLEDSDSNAQQYIENSGQNIDVGTNYYDFIFTQDKILGPVLNKGNSKISNFSFYTYCTNLNYSNIIFVIHGFKRNASNYLNYCKELSTKLNALIIAHEFKESQFKGST